MAHLTDVGLDLRTNSEFLTDLTEKSTKHGIEHKLLVSKVDTVRSLCCIVSMLPHHHHD